MGYRSNFNIHIHNVSKEEAKQILEQLEVESGFCYFPKTGDFNAYIDDVKWYNCTEDCAKIAKAHPDAIIIVTVEGERPNDTWEARFHGEEQEVQHMYMPAFKTIRIPKQTPEPGPDEKKRIESIKSAIKQMDNRYFQTITLNVASYIQGYMKAVHPEKPDSEVDDYINLWANAWYSELLRNIMDMENIHILR